MIKKKINNLLNKVWDSDSISCNYSELKNIKTRRSVESFLKKKGLLPENINKENLKDELGFKPKQKVFEYLISKSRNMRHLVLFAQIHKINTDSYSLHLNDLKGKRYWIFLNKEELLDNAKILKKFNLLQNYFNQEISIFPSFKLVASVRNFSDSDKIKFNTSAFYPPNVISPKPLNKSTKLNKYLEQLESESVYILREAVAESENPVMLYSIGKDSSVMLHLAKKAFYPGVIPFPLLHVDTGWKFREMYTYREFVAKLYNVKIIKYKNPEALKRKINPFDHGSNMHTHITKTEGLKKALDKYEFDVIFGGARRDEENSRAKERVCSFRNAKHEWDPKNQRPELWNLYNFRKKKGESIRVFPLSNWTEKNIWEYIEKQNIPVVPLYFAKKRPVVKRDKSLIVIDDDRFKFSEKEKIFEKIVRFRTLGCYPLTAAIESNAKNLKDIISEISNSKFSERQGRLIDFDSSSSMEAKKKEGYF